MAVLCEQRAGWRGVKMEPDMVLLICQALEAMPKSMLAINNMTEFNSLRESRRSPRNCEYQFRRSKWSTHFSLLQGRRLVQQEETVLTVRMRS